MQSQWRYWKPYISPFDPCPPQTVKRYVVPVNQYIVFQAPGLPQYPPHKALRRGTLWPSLYSPYDGRGDQGAGEICE
ncbi:MAG TPA: spore coat associated protein CotJA [Candidatus Bathyarchaeia archaeon]|nr:spore coat associated protein CotJA [Candidatus Bathyarchaeia archaeon]